MATSSFSGALQSTVCVQRANRRPVERELQEHDDCYAHEYLSCVGAGKPKLELEIRSGEQKKRQS